MEHPECYGPYNKMAVLIFCKYVKKKIGSTLGSVSIFGDFTLMPTSDRHRMMCSRQKLTINREFQIYWHQFRFWSCTVTMLLLQLFYSILPILNYMYSCYEIIMRVYNCVTTIMNCINYLKQQRRGNCNKPDQEHQCRTTSCCIHK